MTQISCSGVRYSYPGGVVALDGVDLDIGSGEQVAIVGQNGSGKTTLIRHFIGLLRPSEGTVTVDGHDTRKRTVAQLAAVVGLAFQDPDRQIFAGSVEAEVSFGARNLGMSGKEVERSVTEALEAVGLAAERRTNPYDLGYARRKLLTIASVLAMRTPVVVLDEPTTGQDARGVATLERIVQDLAQAGRSVVCVSHDMSFVARTFRRVVVMRKGKVILDGSPVEVFAESNWDLLGSTNLQPPYAARIGASLGLGATPTKTAVVDALLKRQ